MCISVGGGAFSVIRLGPPVRAPPEPMLFLEPYSKEISEWSLVPCLFFGLNYTEQLCLFLYSLSNECRRFNS